MREISSGHSHSDGRKKLHGVWRSSNLQPFYFRPGQGLESLECRLLLSGDQPVVDLNGAATGTGYTSTWTDAGPVAIADPANATIADTETSDLSSLTATLSSPQSGDLLAANVAGTSITSSYSATSGALTLSGPDTVADYQQVLRTLTYDETATSPAKVGVIGDSLSSEYNTFAENWVEQFGSNAGSGGINFGVYGSYPSPRDIGYAYNWALGGATSNSMFSDGQVSGLLQQIPVEGIQYAVLEIGSDDIGPTGAIYNGIYYSTWTQSQITNEINTVVSNINTAINDLTATGVKVVVATAADHSLAPGIVAIYPVAAQRQLVSNVIHQINLGIIADAQQDHVVVADLGGLQTAAMGTDLNPATSFSVGNVPLDLTASATSNPSNAAWIFNGTHPNSALQGVMANMFAQALDEGYDAGIPLFSEQQILATQGLTYGGSNSLPAEIGPYSNYVFDYAPTTKTVNVTATDSLGGVSAAATATIDIAVAPIVQLNAPNANYSTSWAGTGAVAIDNPSTAAIADPECSTLASMTVTLSTHTAGDVLTATGTTSGSGTVTVTAYNATTGVLLLSGYDTLADYLTVLNTVKYNNTTPFGPGISSETVNVQANDGVATGNIAQATITNNLNATPATVAGTDVFYSLSKFDGATHSAGQTSASDDAAIDTSKSAYLPGSGNATFSSVTAYNDGINGLDVDLTAAPVTVNHASITAADFIFKVGNNQTPSGWTTLSAANVLTVVDRPGAGAGGSDRIEILFATNAIKDTWLEVQVKGFDAAGGPDTNTGLASTYTFFYGNIPGDTGAGDTKNFSVNSTDASAVEGNQGGGLTVTSIYDFNKDKSANSTDVSLAQSSETALVLLNVSVSGPFAPDGAPSSDPSASSDAADANSVVSGLTDLATNAIQSGSANRSSAATWIKQAETVALNGAAIAALLADSDVAPAKIAGWLGALDEVAVDAVSEDILPDSLLGELVPDGGALRHRPTR